MNREKQTCPICSKKATWSHQFFTHFFGAHMKQIDNAGEMREIIKQIEGSDMKDCRKELLSDALNEWGPQEYDHENEENLISDDVDKNINDEPDYRLSKYLNGNSSICREERQYALFLANALLKNVGEIKKKLNMNSCSILEIYYEATFMRDFWFIYKTKFNEKLCQYANEKDEFPKISCRNDVRKHANFWDNKHTLACWMMNAKPDIAVIYEENNKKYLSFIECKYKSNEDKYKYKVNGEDRFYSQTKLQNDILDFLCNTLAIKYKNTEEELSKGIVLLAQFRDNDSIEYQVNSKGTHYVIMIKDLIKHGYK